MGVEFDQAQQFLGLGPGRAVGETRDHPQDFGEGFDWPAGIGVGKRRAGDRLAAQMIMGVGVGVPAGCERAQRRRAGELGVDQHHQVLPAAERFVIGVGVSALDDRLEPPPVEGFDKLAENGRSKAHAPLSFLSLCNQKIPRNLIKFPGFAGHALRHVKSALTLPRTAVRSKRILADPVRARTSRPTKRSRRRTRRGAVRTARRARSAPSGRSGRRRAVARARSSEAASAHSTAE